MRNTGCEISRGVYRDQEVAPTEIGGFSQKEPFFFNYFALNDFASVLYREMLDRCTHITRDFETMTNVASKLKRIQICFDGT